MTYVTLYVLIDKLKGMIIHHPASGETVTHPGGEFLDEIIIGLVHAKDITKFI